MGPIEFTLRSTFRTGWTIGLLILAVVCLPAAAGAAGSGDSPAEFPAAADASGLPEVEIVSHTRVVRNPRSSSDAAVPVGPALRAIVDPVTGQLISAPATGVPEPALSPRMERALSTSHHGLHEIRLPDGTVMVDLQGRFMSVLRARIGEDGTVSVGHLALPGRCADPAATATPRAAGGGEDR